MFKKMMIVLAMTVGLASMVSAAPSTQQVPLPCNCGGTGN
jgi:hypothetical protein